MPNRTLSYRTLQRDLWKRAIPYTFSEGQGGVVTFLGAVGAGLLAVVFQMPELAGALGGVLVGLEALMARGYLRDSTSRPKLLRRALAHHIDTSRIADERLRAACARAIDIFIEIAGKVAERDAGRGANDDLERVAAAACEMLALQYGAARRVEEYGRLFRLLEQGAPRGAGRSIASLRDENVRTMQKLIADERQLVTDIGARMETALLQVLQVSRGAAEAMRASELAEAADVTLHDMQALVEARRETADLIRRTVAPDQLSATNS
jgi:hypothetical protein